MFDQGAANRSEDAADQRAFLPICRPDLPRQAVGWVG